MSIEDNKAIVRRIYEAFNTRKLEALDDLLTADFIDHSASVEQKPGAEGIRQAWSALHAAFPNIRFVVEDMIAEADKVATRGAFQGIPPEGKRMMEFVRLRDDRVAELWNIVG